MPPRSPSHLRLFPALLFAGLAACNPGDPDPADRDPSEPTGERDAITAAAERLQGPGADEGAFVVRLGTDTLAVEGFTLHEDRMEILAVTRSPRTLLREVTLEFHEEGGLARFESRVRDPQLPPEADPILRTAIHYEGDRAIVETGVGEEAVEEEVEAGRRMIPLSFDHFSLEELAIRWALAENSDQVTMLSGGPAPMRLRRPSPDSVVLETPQLGNWEARVDEEGRIQGMFAGALGREVERVPGLDIAAMARRFAAEDARGEGMGVLSPRDTLRATVHGAALSVDYSRPAARGRQVFGGLVPWGEVWRLGADVATHLTTDRNLLLGGERLPAGSYTLFAVPEPDRWTLMVNEETGQPGTSYDPDRDLFQVELEVTPLEDPVNRFTILAEEEGEEGVLRFLWEETEARLPFRVEGG